MSAWDPMTIQMVGQIMLMVATSEQWPRANLHSPQAVTSPGQQESGKQLLQGPCLSYPKQRMTGSRELIQLGALWISIITAQQITLCIMRPWWSKTFECSFGIKRSSKGIISLPGAIKVYHDILAVQITRHVGHHEQCDEKWYISCYNLFIVRALDAIGLSGENLIAADGLECWLPIVLVWAFCLLKLVQPQFVAYGSRIVVWTIADPNSLPIQKNVQHKHETLDHWVSSSPQPAAQWCRLE